MEPFRDRHFTCPACHALLREHADRLVCETCNGILLELDDLHRAIVELVAVEPTLEVEPLGAGSRTCPRCTSAMSRVRVNVLLENKTVKVRAELDRCSAHGLWCDDGELAQVFEAVNKRFSPQHGEKGAWRSPGGGPWWKGWRGR